MKRPLSCQPDRQHAVALIVTLIMLAVITVLAVAFLALTRRETAAVDAMGRTTEAELATDSGLERAKAEILAAFIRRNATNNGLERLGPDFMVSIAFQSNWLNSVGMFTNPSPPVFANTNRPGAALPTRVADLDNRFYLDLNRNGSFEETGYVPETDNGGNIIPNTFHWEAGDPQWIGILQQPEFPHSRTNPFVGRYAFAVLPVGRGLDINWIHNQTISGRPVGNDAYFRNQGFGTYEINLAAFLADLNTNAWHRPSTADPDAYAFDSNPSPAALGSRGLAFFDARELLDFRYNGSRNNLLSVNQMFPSIDTHFGWPASGFPDWIDGYANGPVEPLGGPIHRQANPNPNPEANDNPDQPWPGSDNPRRFFALHDFFDSSKLNPNTFSRRLRQAGETGNSYDRYTYYRMLAQLGTESEPESGGKININYKNRDGFSARQFESWKPIEMFTNIAERLLRDEFGIGVHRIPIFTNGSINAINGRRNDGPLYSARIHQMLQMAANICDATYSNKFDEASAPFYPSVFRPRFDVRGNDVFIVDYEEVTDVAPLNATFLSLDEQADRARISPNANIHIYGIPFIIGARKGFPNFNELVMQSAVEVSRKLEFVKNAAADPRPRRTNQMFVIGISNTFAMEAWYPYTNMGAYPPVGRQAGIKYGSRIIATLTNDVGLNARWDFAITGVDGVLSQSWTGGMFKVPPIVVTNILQNSVYRQSPTPRFELVSGNNAFDPSPFYTNRWGLLLTNRFFYFLTERGLDGREHIVDAVSLAGTDKFLDITTGLSEGDDSRSWRQDLVRGIPSGIENQIQISLGQGPGVDWNSFGGQNPTTGQDREKAIDGFRVFLGLNPLRFPLNQLPSPSTVMQAPFTPARKLYQTTSWAVNDPLVHHRVEEMSPEPAYSRFTNQTDVGRVSISTFVSLAGSYSTLSNRNREYQPWGGRFGSSDSFADYDSALKDPGVFNPDFWDFPLQKFPNVGWLGRVHRGTPWQTIYLKSTPTTPRTWFRQVGGAFDTRTMPTNDWRLPDLFTVAVHPNQTRGRLSINQTNVAAWSAVLSGIQVSTIEDNGSGLLVRTNQTAQPAAVDYPIYGTNAALLQLLDGPSGLSVTRTNGNRRSLGFTQLADILAVPAFTDRSPFLGKPYSKARFGEQGRMYQYPALDSDYERIPQQILSLLRTGDSRFVVYAWGQSLRPAGTVPGFGPSTEVSGADKGLVRNYQVTGEMATRAVVRVEFDDELARDDDGNLIVDANGNPVKTGRRDYRKPHAVVESYNIIPVD